jgi:DNA-binding MarR family transcriptional regulator
VSQSLITTPATDVPNDVSIIADQLIALMQSLNRARQQVLASAHRDVERSAHLLLRCVSNDGPMRATDLAERVQADPSTISRQVAYLVSEGLLERRADPIDGRATLLAATGQASSVLAKQDDLRLRRFSAMMAEWTHTDVAAFARLLTQFTQDFERFRVD